MAWEDLPEEVRDTARIEPNGEVGWHMSDAQQAIRAITDAGHTVYGMDMQTQYPDGGVMEVPFADCEGLNAEESCAMLLGLLADYDGSDGECVHVTWDGDCPATPRR